MTFILVIFYHKLQLEILETVYKYTYTNIRKIAEFYLKFVGRVEAFGGRGEAKTQKAFWQFFASLIITIVNGMFTGHIIMCDGNKAENPLFIETSNQQQDICVMCG